jgi:hypothetical protein
VAGVSCGHYSAYVLTLVSPDLSLLMPLPFTRHSTVTYVVSGVSAGRPTLRPLSRPYDDRIFSVNLNFTLLLLNIDDISGEQRLTRHNTLVVSSDTAERVLVDGTTHTPHREDTAPKKMPRSRL